MQTTTLVAPKVSQAIGTSATAVGGYSPAGAAGAIISSIVACNITGGSILVTVDLFNGTTATRLAVNAPVAPGDALVLGGESMKIILVNPWVIRVTSNTASSVDATLSVTEFT